VEGNFHGGVIPTDGELFAWLTSVIVIETNEKITDLEGGEII